MPEYLFRDTETGDEVGVFFNMADSALPSIGDEIVRGGRTLVRLMSPHMASSRGFTPHVSVQARLNDPHAPRHNKDGEAVFHSRKEIDEYTARVNDDPTRPNVKWDP